MEIAAIICEYNPFHNGHKYQIDKARSITGCDAFVGLMSGNYVQRGDFAIFPKEVRAKACIKNGIDLVIENPAYLTLRSAEGYAFSAVNILNSLGNIDYLVFGGETDDLDKLYALASFLCNESNEFKSTLTDYMSKGFSFAAAREKTTESILGEDIARLLKTPNNLLGIEYLKALIRLNSNIRPIIIKRRGVEHNGQTPAGEFASATNLRMNLEVGTRIDDYIPQNVLDLYNVPFDKRYVDRAILSALSLKSLDDFRNTPDVSEGLENRIKSELLSAQKVDELIASIKSKRYAYSRIKRALMCAYLSIDKAESEKSAEYIKILDFNNVGQRVLNSAKKTAILSLAKNASPILKNESAMIQWKKEMYRDKVYKLFWENL